MMINKISIKPYKSINNIDTLNEANLVYNYIFTIEFLSMDFNTLNKFCILNNYSNFHIGNDGYSINVDLLNKFLKLHPNNYFHRITMLLYPFNDDYLFHCCILKIMYYTLITSIISIIKFTKNLKIIFLHYIY